MSAKPKRNHRVGDRVKVITAGSWYMHEGKITSGDGMYWTVEFKYHNGSEAMEFFTDELKRV